MNRRPDPLFVFERLAALEKALVSTRNGEAPLRLALEAIAALHGDAPGAADRAVAIARAALGR